MNYNANTGPRQATFGKKVKRVSDVNAMGYNPYDSPPPAQPAQQPNIYPDLSMTPNLQMQGGNFQQGYAPDPIYMHNMQQGPQVPPYNTPTQPVGAQQYLNSFPMTPMVQDMAMQYGQQLAGAGKTMIKQEVEKYVPVSKLKFYFAVDTKYVLTKLALLFFPFTHQDWSVKYEQNIPVQPRYEINAPDLYIPSMAYITYILVAGLVLGTQNKFTPETISITASSALAWCLLELAIYCITLYTLQVETSLKTLDLLAYAGYKFVGIIVSVLVGLVAGRMGFYVTLIYTNLALAFFLVRSLKMQVLMENSGTYGGQVAGHKRRTYFLLFVAGAQPLLAWWLSYHLVPLASAVSG